MAGHSPPTRSRSISVCCHCVFRGRRSVSADPLARLGRSGGAGVSFGSTFFRPTSWHRRPAIPGRAVVGQTRSQQGLTTPAPGVIWWPVRSAACRGCSAYELNTRSPDGHRQPADHTAQTDSGSGRHALRGVFLTDNGFVSRNPRRSAAKTSTRSPASFRPRQTPTGAGSNLKEQRAPWPLPDLVRRARVYGSDHHRRQNPQRHAGEVRQIAHGEQQPALVACSDLSLVRCPPRHLARIRLRPAPVTKTLGRVGRQGRAGRHSICRWIRGARSTWDQSR